MTQRLLALREAEVQKLSGALAGAGQRITYYRGQYPVLDDRDVGRFLDGSATLTFGASLPQIFSYRMWGVGEVDRRTVLIYELAPDNLDEFAANTGAYKQHAPLKGTYALAIQGLNYPKTDARYTGILRIPLEGLAADTTYSLDYLVQMTDLLGEFFASPAAFKAEVERFTSEFDHESESKLVLP